MNKILMTLLILALAVMFCSCTDNNKQKIEISEVSTIATNGYAFTDDLGFNVTLTTTPKRVVALTGSYGETWLLAGGTLIASTSDIETERNLDLPKDFNIIGTAMDVNNEQLVSANPDFVLLSTEIESHKKIGLLLDDLKIAHAFFKVEYFEDYLNMLKICTDITQRNDLYIKNGLNIKNEITNLLKENDTANNATALLLRAYSSGFNAKNDKNTTGRMLSQLGYNNIATQTPSLLESLSMEEIIKQDPDYIFVITMGKDTEKALSYLYDSIQKNPAWAELSAVKNSHYYVLPKELFQYKPNAKWGEAYEYLINITKTK